MRRFFMSRKFALALLLCSFGGTALGLSWLTGGEFVALATIVMGAYGASNILQPKFEKDPTEEA